MLSIVDIKKELGKNIYIYPIHSESIKANSIDLHASRFAWSVKTKKMLQVRNDKHLVIPANDTALIYTEEAIYVSNKIGGSYHSKVMYVSAGLGHIGTTLDAGYMGLSLIAIHNHNNHDFCLEIGHELVTIHFHYLHTAGYDNAQPNNNFPGHPRLLNKYETDDYESWIDQNTWCTNSLQLYTKMFNSSEFSDLKKTFELEKKKFSRYKILYSIKNIIISLVLLLMASFLVAIPAYLIDVESINLFWSKLCEIILYPAFSAIFASVVVHEVFKYRHDK